MGLVRKTNIFFLNVSLFFMKVEHHLFLSKARQTPELLHLRLREEAALSIPRLVHFMGSV